MTRRCTAPPRGWACTRRWGHPGPCAARRTCTWRLPVYLCFLGMLVAALLDLACPRAVGAQPARETYSVAYGPMHANDGESAECYFNVGYGVDSFMIVTHPKNVACLRLRTLVDKRVTIQVVVEP